LKNKELMSKLQSNWYQNNKEHIYTKYKERYNSDLMFKIRGVCRRRVSSMLKKNGKSIIDFLGCNIIFLKAWFNFCYIEDMTDDNHGTYWHIDHVIPISLFDLENENDKKLGLSWYNLSPLKANDNLSKNNTIDKSQIKQHLSKLYEFLDDIDIKEYTDLCAKYLDAGNSLELQTTTSH